MRSPAAAKKSLLDWPSHGRFLPPSAEMLCECLGRLESRPRLRRTENPQAAPLEFIHDPRRQRIIRTDDREGNALARRKIRQRYDVRNRDRHIAPELFRASIARRAIQRGHTRRLMQLPAQRVFATATADNEDFHRKDSCKGRLQKMGEAFVA